jgi:hypothetical protein
MRFRDEITMDQGTKPAYHGESACLLEARFVFIYEVFMLLRGLSEPERAGGCRMAAGSYSEENKQPVTTHKSGKEAGDGDRRKIPGSLASNRP